MANQSIYSERWIDLVFENRNKEYGAYQLRQENPKTTLKALAIGFLLITFLVSIPIILNKFGEKPLALIENLPPVILVDASSIVFPPEKKPVEETVAPLTKKETEQPKTEVKKDNLIDPTVTVKENAKTDINTNEEAQNTTSKPSEGGILGSENGGIKGGTGTLLEGNADGTNGTDNETHISAILDKQPTFPGGMNKFYTYVGRNFKTPDTEIANTIKVYVSFVIEKDGSMTDIEVLGNPGYGLDREAIRVLKSLKTKWTPGILNGKPVRTSYNLPIVVKQN
ncbi:energy transducer TonB [Flavobacterium sp. SM2513]|uniref:energy transducer TonB n=1 Tax=Flavobacterium sp. SM2513 TaxID=3424766 RepID=UPI003D7F7EEF